MPHDDPRRDLDPVAQNIIRRKAKKLMHRGGFSSSDLPDLEQDLTLHLFQRMPAFDPRRGSWFAFVTAVVTAWDANLLRARHAAKRDYHRARPLRVTCEPDHDARLGRPRHGDREQHELQLDVRHALQQLPEELRQLAERLQHLSIAELARTLGMPRSTLYEFITRIRRRFERMGLGKNH